MIQVVFVILVFFIHSEFAYATECTMRPTPIDAKRIARNPNVKSYTIAESRLVLNALLKNGNAVRIIHEGCAHSGSKAAVWLDSSTSLTDIREWLDEVIKLARIAFEPNVVREIEALIKNGNYSKDEVSEERLSISATPAEYIYYSMVVSRAEQGYVLLISYIEG